MSLPVPFGAARPVAYSARRGVSVRVGSARPAGSREEPVGVVVVGVCAPDAPWLADQFPRAVVRDTRFRDPYSAVEHIRLRSRDSVEGLPGLSGPHRSRVRDAVRLALSVGAPSVDVILARVGGAKPWQLDSHELHEALDGFLDLIPGAALVFPDLGGPIPVGPGTRHDPELRVQTALDSIRRITAKLPERYQIALMDHPELPGIDELRLFRGLLGSDVGLCRWRGAEDRLREHGWRSCAAVVGGMLGAQGAEVGLSLTGRTIHLPTGRAIARHRVHDLSLHEDLALRSAEHEDLETCVELALDSGLERALVLAEPTFRQPVGTWPLGALRAVKAIHRRLMEAAERFVFESVDEAHAVALGVSLRRVLRDFSERGLLVGPDGQGQPLVEGTPDRTPGEPSLVAVIDATLRPWSQKVSVQLSLRPGNRPVLEAT